MAVALVTGTGSGLGREIAAELARRGHRVFAGIHAGKSAGARAAAAPMPAGDGADARMQPLRLDVTDTASIAAAVRLVVQQAGRIDILVNNAGVHRLGAFEDMPEEQFRAMLEVNFFGAVRMTRAVLPLMRRQRAGHVIMISSVGAHVARAADAYYCASKSALDAATEALRHEVARFGIHVTLVEPGAFRTAIADKGAALAPAPGSAYAPLVEFRIRKVREACANGDDPSIVARAVADLAASRSPPLRAPVGAQAAMFLRHLAALEAPERDAAIRERSQVDWWIRGADSPSG